MTKPEARKVARKLDGWGYHAIEIVEAFPEGTMSVRCMNRAWMPRTIETMIEFAYYERDHTS